MADEHITIRLPRHYHPCDSTSGCTEWATDVNTHIDNLQAALDRATDNYNTVTELLRDATKRHEGTRDHHTHPCPHNQGINGWHCEQWETENT